MRPVGAELFQAEGRTGRQIDMTKIIVGFHASKESGSVHV
jgi:hypothetical protein